MAKLPAFQFYPGDWLQDSIAGCSLAAQGLWLRMMFIAHNSETYGYLGSKLAPMTPSSIAQRCGCTLDQYTILLSELELNGIPSRTPAGTIFSRRMIRDAKCRADNKHRQQDFRNSHKVNGNSNATVTAMSQCSSSSTSSSTTKLKTKTKATPQAAVVLPDWIPVEPWEAFVSMRIKQRWPLSERAKRGIIRDLDRLRTIGNDIGEVLDRSEKNVWRGVFPLPGPAPERRGETRYENKWDRVERETLAGLAGEKAASHG